MSRQVTVSLAAAVIAAAALVIASVAYVARTGRAAEATDAQGVSGDRAESRRALDFTDEELRDVVDAIQIYTMAKELGLSESQLAQVASKWRKLVDTRRAFWSERGERLDRLTEVVELQEADGSASAEGIASAVESFRSEDVAFWSAYWETEQALLGVLDGEQVARYLVLSSSQARGTRCLMHLLERARDPDGAER